MPRYTLRSLLLLVLGIAVVLGIAAWWWNDRVSVRRDEIERAVEDTWIFVSYRGNNVKLAPHEGQELRRIVGTILSRGGEERPYTKMIAIFGVRFRPSETSTRALLALDFHPAASGEAACEYRLGRDRPVIFFVNKELFGQLEDEVARVCREDERRHSGKLDASQIVDETDSAKATSIEFGDLRRKTAAGPTEFDPADLTEETRRLDKKRVSIRGYMIAYKKHGLSRFLLVSEQRMNFKPYELDKHVLVLPPKGETVSFQSGEVTVEGTLAIDPLEAEGHGIYSIFQLTEAEVVKD